MKVCVVLRLAEMAKVVAIESHQVLDGDRTFRL